MKRILFFSAMMLLGLVLVIGGGAAYLFLATQDRGLTRDGRIAPPASVRNAPEAPKYDHSSKAPPPASIAPSPEMPTEFKMPTELDISTPKVPEGIAAPADGDKR